MSCLDVESVTCMPSSADTFSIASGLRRKLFRRFSVSMLADEATAVVPRSVDTAPKPHDKGTWTWMGPIISLTVLQYVHAGTNMLYVYQNLVFRSDKSSREIFCHAEFRSVVHHAPIFSSCR